jgi:hypothetical protein
MNWREMRAAELRELRQCDPIKLLAMYRNLVGLGVDSQLPQGVSFTAMIEALLDDEDSSGNLASKANE